MKSAREISYEDIASKIGRARSYVGLRISGLKPEYASAEVAYGGDPYLMAKSLEVTVQVLEDYQKIIQSKHVKATIPSFIEL